MLKRFSNLLIISKNVYWVSDWVWTKNSQNFCWLLIKNYGLDLRCFVVSRCNGKSFMATILEKNLEKFCLWAIKMWTMSRFLMNIRALYFSLRANGSYNLQFFSNSRFFFQRIWSKIASRSNWLSEAPWIQSEKKCLKIQFNRSFQSLCQNRR